LPRASARQRLALGKANFAESSTLSTNRTSAKPQPHKRLTYAVIFAKSLLLGSRQNIFLCREPQLRLSAIFFLIFAFKFFVQPCYSIISQQLKFGVFFIPLAIFRVFFHFLDFFSTRRTFELQVHEIINFSD
jgi:hypothetical protein